MSGYTYMIKVELVDLLTRFGNVKIHRRKCVFGGYGCIYHGPGNTDNDTFVSRNFNPVSRLEARTLVAEVQNELRKQ